MRFDEALHCALDGDAVVFLGAGFSLGATNSLGGTFKSGWAFSKHLSAKVHLPDSTDLVDAAEAFVATHGASELAKEITQEFRATDVAKHHISIAQVPWRRVYTTNYDNVFELAAAKANIAFRAVTLSERPRDFKQDERLCVHFNGYVERLTPSPGDEIRLTDTSYITTSVESSPWSSVFRLDLTMAKSVFFVGYSMSDLDIARLLAATKDMEEKTFFLVGQKPSQRTITRATRFGTLQSFDTAWLSKQIDAERARYTPPDRTQPSWFCLEEYRPRISDTTAVSDKAVFDLFLRGIIDDKLLWNSIQGSAQPYLIPRTCGPKVLSICADTTRIAAVHSNLGNGKSVVAESVKALAAAEGRAVYSLEKRSPSLRDELSYLATSATPFLLVVDGYPPWLDALEYLGTHRNDKMSLLVTARTSAHDLLVDRLEEIFSGRSVQEICVDTMDDLEITAVTELFQNYGLWGAKAGLSKQHRERHIRNRCRREWQAVLVDLFQSPQIADRFDALLSSLEKKSGQYDILIGILVLTLINERVSVNMLADLFGNRILDLAVQRDQLIAEFVDFRRGEVYYRSSVAARFVLSRVADPNLTVDVVAGIASWLDKYVYSNGQYSETLRSLVQFSQVETLLPNRDIQDRRNATFRYYERIKNLTYCRSNPQFWLQYAIASLVFEDFERAEKYFESAYSFAGRIAAYDTHKIDNHYARLLLEKACRCGSKEEAMRHFRSARHIVFEQIQKERLHYPYRVAKKLGDFFWEPYSA